jgi:hypothetical protein
MSWDGILDGWMGTSATGSPLAGGSGQRRRVRLVLAATNPQAHPFRLPAGGRNASAAAGDGGMVTHEESSESETGRRDVSSMVLAQSVVLSETVPGSRRGSRGWGLGGSEVAGFGGFASATSRCVSPQPHSETDGIGLKDL